MSWFPIQSSLPHSQKAFENPKKFFQQHKTILICFVLWEFYSSQRLETKAALSGVEKGAHRRFVCRSIHLLFLRNTSLHCIHAMEKH
jgi:hypothetical protein